MQIRLLLAAFMMLLGPAALVALYIA